MLDVDARHRDHLFLLGLAPLALACSVGVPDDGPSFTSTPPSTPSGGDAADDDTGTGTGTGGGSADGDTNGGPDDGMSVSVSVSVGDDTTSGASSDASASMSASVSVSVGEEGTTYDYTSGPMPGGYGCEAYGYLFAACYFGGDPMEAANLTMSCEQLLEYYQSYYGPACAMAFEDALACLTQLSCQQIPMYQNFCQAEAQGVSAACS
jgi:hypothetical protein